jgi:hypothetical protein
MAGPTLGSDCKLEAEDVVADETADEVADAVSLRLICLEGWRD